MENILVTFLRKLDHVVPNVPHILQSGFGRLPDELIEQLVTLMD